jgi:hypothetical protein
MSFCTDLQDCFYTLEKTIYQLERHLSPIEVIDPSTASVRDLAIDIFKKITAATTVLGGAGLVLSAGLAAVTGALYLQGTVISYLTLGYLTALEAAVVGTLAPYLLAAATVAAIAGAIGLGIAVAGAGIVFVTNRIT